MKPECRRCKKGKIACAGYGDSWTTLVRHQEQWAKDKVAQRVDSKLKERKRQDFETHACLMIQQWHQPPSYIPTTTSTIPPVCWVGPEEYAINRFYADYALTSGTIPFLDQLPALHASLGVPSCLLSIVPAVALASSARQLSRYDLMEQAKRHYGHALKSLRSALSDEKLALQDSISFTIFLLGLFEVCFPLCWFFVLIN